MLNVLGEAKDHVANHMIIEKRFYQKDMQTTFLNKVDVGDNLKRRIITYQKFYRSSKDQ